MTLFHLPKPNHTKNGHPDGWPFCVRRFDLQKDEREVGGIPCQKGETACAGESMVAHGAQQQQQSSGNGTRKAGAKAMGAMREEVPTTKSRLNTLLPTMLPMAMSALPRLAAETEVNSSGREVPRATMVRPIRRSLRPRKRAIDTAASTAMSLPKTMHSGLPMITQQVCMFFAPLLINRTIIAIGGSIAMSAMSVKSSILNFCVIIGSGVAESVALMTHILYSEKDATSLKQTVKSALHIHLMLCTLFSILLFIFAGTLTTLYFTPLTEEWILAKNVVRCLALSLPVNGCNLILVEYLHSARLPLLSVWSPSFSLRWSLDLCLV